MVRRVVVAVLLAFVLMGAKPTPKLTVSPAVIHVGDTYTVSGPAPLHPDGTAKVNLCNPGCLIAFAASWSDGTGTFSQVARFPGTYIARFIGERNGRLYVASEVRFEVAP